MLIRVTRSLWVEFEEFGNESEQFFYVSVTDEESFRLPDEGSRDYGYYYLKTSYALIFNVGL